jgi:hypothetical protein
MKKFKTLEELNQWKQNKLSAQYTTVLSEPLTMDEIDILRGKRDVKVSEYNATKSKLESRMDSVLHLICEIDNVGFGWWDYDHEESDDIRIHDDYIEFYFEDDYHYPGTNSMYDSLLFSDEQELPLVYLFLDKDIIIKNYIEDTYQYYLKEIQRLQKQADKRKKIKDYEGAILAGIKAKLSDDEYKFVLRKMGFKKKQIEKLGL